MNNLTDHSIFPTTADIFIFLFGLNKFTCVVKAEETYDFYS